MYLTSISSRLLLYDVNNWELKKSFGSYNSIIRDINWSDDGKYLLQVNPKGVIEILSTAEEVRSLQQIPFADTWSATFQREGYQNIAIGTKNGNVIIWDTKGKSIAKSFPTQTHPSCVNFISYNLKNTTIAASMHNGETVIYSLVSNIPVSTVKLTQSRSISAMKFHPDSRSLLGLATDEGHIILRDITTNKDKAFFENVHASPISDFTFSQINKDVMLSSGYDKMMHVYDIRLQNIVSTLRTNYTLTAVTTNPDNLVALGTKNGVILIYDLRDMTCPLKTLKGHYEEVRRLAFQPSKKKNLSTEFSLREEADVHTPVQRRQSPAKSRVSDIFMINDSPLKSSPDQPTNDSRVDSFLVMMGLDKSNNDNDEYITKSDYLTDKRIDNNGFGFSQERDKNLSKISTPLTNRPVEQFGIPSPLNLTGNVECEKRNLEITNSHTKQYRSDVNTLGSIDNRTMEELKDFMKLTMSEVADENRNYFLRTMMVLTKQKLYLEKQLASMAEQMQSLAQNQNALVETNRKLALEIDKLKMAQQYPL